MLFDYFIFIIPIDQKRCAVVLFGPSVPCVSVSVTEIHLYDRKISSILILLYMHVIYTCDHDHAPQSDAQSEQVSRVKVGAPLLYDGGEAVRNSRPSGISILYYSC